MQRFTCRSLVPSLAVSIQRLLNRIEQLLVAERLGQKLQGTGFQGADGHRDVAVTANEDNWNCPAGVSQSSLEVKSAQTRHPHIEHKAAGDIRMLAPQEILSRSEKLNSKSDRSNKVLERIPHRSIIIDDEHRRVGIHHALPPSRIGSANWKTAPWPVFAAQRRP